MAHNDRNQARYRPPALSTPPRKATVVHDGCAFELAADLRHYGFDVMEGPLLSARRAPDDAEQLVVLATRPGAARPSRLQAWTRELCWHGATVLAAGAAVAPVAELFGASTSSLGSDGFTPAARLSSITSTQVGLFSGAPSEFRLALPAGHRVASRDLNAEFGVTAVAKDGELVGASHVFRPVHLLHMGALESAELRPIVLRNLLRLVRERGGRAF